jgi:hypothetical protein
MSDNLRPASVAVTSATAARVSARIDCRHRLHSAPGCASTSVSTRRMNASNASREWNRATW